MILDEIITNKKQELANAPRQRFRAMLKNPGLSLICELKLKSPTHPEPFTHDPETVLRDYKDAQVDAISVITDHTYFGGSTELVKLAHTTKLPILRKDFILEARQIIEVKADAILLIARVLTTEKLKELVAMCLKLDIEPVVEIHADSELENVLASDAQVIAVNSRDLQTQRIDIGAGLKLLDSIPNDRLKLFFSGISSAADMTQVKEHRANGVLIGTSILTSDSRVHKIRELRSGL